MIRQRVNMCSKDVVTSQRVGGLARRFTRAIRRPLLLLMVLTVTLAMAGTWVIPSNGVGYLQEAVSSNYHIEKAYQYLPGTYWVNPAYARQEVRLGHTLPDVDDFLNAARVYDQAFDELVGMGMLANPTAVTPAQFEPLCATIASYLREQPSLLADFEFNGVILFTPEKGSSRYDVELASWHRVAVDDRGEVAYDAEGRVINDNHIYVNVGAMQEQLSKSESILGLLTHEMTHGALSVTIPPTTEQLYMQETLDQIITADVLRQMMLDEVPGSAAAFYEHMRDLALYSAKYQAYFSDQVLPYSYTSTLYVSYYWRGEAAVTPTVASTWEAPPENSTARVDVLGALLELARGNFYTGAYSYGGDGALTALQNALTATILYVRQNGVHVQPWATVSTLLKHPSAQVIAVARALLGPGYATVGWTLVRGDKDRYDAVEEELVGNLKSGEFPAAWEDHNSYFRATWWEYEYAPMMVLWAYIYNGQPIQFYELTTSNINALFSIVDYASFVEAFRAVELQLPKDAWASVLAPLGTTAAPEPKGIVWFDESHNIGTITTNDAGQWRLFPSVALLLAGLMLLKDVAKATLRKWPWIRPVARAMYWRVRYAVAWVRIYGRAAVRKAARLVWVPLRGVGRLVAKVIRWL